MPIPIRILVVDDHPHIHELVTLALHGLEDLVVVGYGRNGQEAITLCHNLTPDVVLMDIKMPQMDGIEATRHLHEQFPHIKILVLSSFQGDNNARLILQAGAVGYLLKSAIAHDLASMIRSSYHGGAVFSQEVADKLLGTPSTFTPPKPDYGLTERELEVLKRLAQGLNNVEIAAELVISNSTVKFHLTNLLQKMKVETRAEAIVLAVKNDLL